MSIMLLFAVFLMACSSAWGAEVRLAWDYTLDPSKDIPFSDMREFIMEALLPNASTFVDIKSQPAVFPDGTFNLMMTVNVALPATFRVRATGVGDEGEIISSLPSNEVQVLRHAIAMPSRLRLGGRGVQ